MKRLNASTRIGVEWTIYVFVSLVLFLILNVELLGGEERIAYTADASCLHIPIADLLGQFYIYQAHSDAQFRKRCEYK